MTLRFCTVLFLAALIGPAACDVQAKEQQHQQQRVTPVTKVIQLLEDMLAKGKKEKQEEEIRFAAFKQFCGDKQSFKSQAIEKAEARIGELDASIQQAQTDIKQLSDEITELNADVDRWETDITAATNVRQKEAADFTATATDYSETLDALDRAIRVLKDTSANVPQSAASALLQVAKFAKVPEKARRAISAFLQQGQEPLGGEQSYNGMAVAAPEANAYEFQSGGIVDMLNNLKDKFREEKSALEEEELNTKHAFEQMVQELNDSVENAKAEESRRQKSRSERVQDLADAKGDLADTTADQDADKKYFSELTALCATKAEDFENRQQLRTEEIAVIEKVIEILSGEAGGVIQKHADKHLPALLQKTSGKKSLVQLRKSLDAPLQGRVAAFLSDRANVLNSRLLSMVAVRAAEDPFGKVKKMIKDLIVKLIEEATEEAESKGWCDTELTTNQQTRDQKTSEVDELTAQTTQLSAQIAQLTQEVSELQADVAEIDEAVAKATADRDEEKAKNAQTIADAKEAQEACNQALSVLKEFYDKAAQATSLVQQSKRGTKSRKQTPGEEAPETFDTAYKGMGAEGGGPLDFLSVIQSDFVRLETETKAAEEQAAEEYDKFMFDSRMDKEMKLNDVKHKEEKKAADRESLAMASKDLKIAREELDAAMAYYEKLKPKCVSSGISYEDRVARRKEEIQSLQEALKILTGMDI